MVTGSTRAGPRRISTAIVSGVLGKTLEAWKISRDLREVLQGWPDNQRDWKLFCGQIIGESRVQHSRTSTLLGQDFPGLTICSCLGKVVLGEKSLYELPRALMLLREGRALGFGEHTGNILYSINPSQLTTSVLHKSDASSP